MGCGPNLFFDGYSFIRSDLIEKDSLYSPYLYGFEDYYEHFQETKLIQVNDNLEEWQQIFCKQARISEIGQVVYDASAADIKLLRTSIQNKNYPLQGRLIKNSFAEHLKANKCIYTVNYLLYAKECEPHVTYYDDWDRPKRDTIMMQTLIKRGLEEFSESKSHYIKLRYAYQLIRLAHYKKNYQQTLKLYNYLMPKINPFDDSILNYWIMGHRAGALMAIGEKVEAAYLYSLIFANCPSKRETAFRSFKITTQAEWDELLLLCQDDRERATLFAIRASRQSARAAEEMEKIYTLFPESPHLELLLVKEMEKLEKDLLGIDFNDKVRANLQFFGYPRKKRGDYVISLHDFVREVIEDATIKNLGLWKIADGYLEFLAGDFYAADLTFKKIENEIVDPVLKKQLAIFRLALRINRWENFDSEDEEEIAEIIQEEPMYKKYKDFPEFMNDRLSYVYLNQGNPGKAFRIRYPLSALKPNPQLDIIEDLLQICREEDPTKLEQALVRKDFENTIENDLLDMKGTRFMAVGKMEAALEILKLIPRSEWDAFQFNPFIERLDPCINCPLPDSTERFNKVEIIQKIFELEYNAKSDFENSAIYFYQLGNAYYNMSYFGYAWNVVDYFRSGSNWYYDKDRIFPYGLSPFGNREYQDLSMAEAYFERARAEATDPELAARAAFMAARCELNTYIVSVQSKYNPYDNTIPKIPIEYRSYYELLNENYHQTNFYQYIIEECKFFAAYANH
jgi:hypothetical protein